MSATYFAATSSLPGGLVVLMRIRPSSQPSASSSSLERSDDCGEVVCCACSWVGTACEGDCRRVWAELAVAKETIQASVRKEIRAAVRAIQLPPNEFEKRQPNRACCHMLMPVQLRRERIILAWWRNAFGKLLRADFLNCN